MDTKIYIYGCACGPLQYTVNKVKLNNNVKVYDTKIDKSAFEDHIRYLKQAGMSGQTYQSIVVQGEEIRLLSQWS